MTTHIKTLLNKFLEKKKEDFKHQERVQQIINRFFKSETQEGIYLKGISGNELIFKADSSSLSYDFGLKKDKILREIKEEFPQIKEIKVEIR